LPPPGIRYSRNAPEVDDKASWNLRGVKFAQGAKLSRWAVLLIQDGNPRDEFSGTNDPELLNTIKGFSKMCRDSGMTVDQEQPLFRAVQLPRKANNDPIRAKAIDDIRSVIQSLPGKPTIILVILSNGDKHVYSGIKHLCDALLDVPTVCVHSSKIRKERGMCMNHIYSPESIC
jgi:eukaryotic translation initiation factor 2C